MREEEKAPATITIFLPEVVIAAINLSAICILENFFSTWKLKHFISPRLSGTAASVFHHALLAPLHQSAQSSLAYLNWSSSPEGMTRSIRISSTIHVVAFDELELRICIYLWFGF